MVTSRRSPFLLVIALAVIAYANAIRNDFALDDVAMIVENPMVRDVGNVETIFESNYWSRGPGGFVGDPTLYRPVTVLTYAVDHAVWGTNATADHVVNVVLHAAVTALVFVIATELLGSTLAAFAAASIFAVHPLHTEAVTGVVGRAELLAALFALGAFIVLRHRSAFRDGGRALFARAVVRAAAGGALYLLGLLSKEIAVTMPALLALDDWLHREEFPRGRRSVLSVLAIRYAPLVVALGVYLGLRQHAVAGNPQMWPGWVGVPTVARMITACRVLMEYVGLFIFPRTLLADYWKTDVPIATSIANPLVVASLVFCAALIAIAIRSVRRAPAVFFSIAWFLITIAPVSNIFFPIGVAKAERLLYLPSVGLCLLTGWAFARAEAQLRSPAIPRVVLAVVLVALVARTIVRNRDWRDNFTLARATLKLSPSSPLMNDIAAAELVKRGNAPQAVPLLEEAVRQAPDMPLIRGHLGIVYYTLGQLDRAIAEYQEAIRRNARDAESHNNLGVVFLAQKRRDEAFAQFKEAVAINPSYVDALMNLGVVHLDRGEFSDAKQAFSSAVAADPGSARAHNALGVAYLRSGQMDRAREEYQEALRLDPSFAPARENIDRLGKAR